MSMDGSDNNATLKAWNTKYGVKYPGCSNEGGAATVESNFGISAFPSVVIVAPNKTVLYKGNWATNVGPKLVSASVKKHTCDTPGVDIDYQHLATKESILSINRVNSNAINFIVPTDGIYSLSIYSSHGQLVEEIFSEKSYLKGTHEISCDLNNLAKNIFLIELKCDMKKITKKVVLM